MQSALIFIVRALTDFYLLTFLLRFLMQWVRASYYNPLAQFVFKVTSPLVIPARRVVPSIAGLDTATLVVLAVLTAQGSEDTAVKLGARQQQALDLLRGAPDGIALSDLAHGRPEVAQLLLAAGLAIDTVFKEKDD